MKREDGDYRMATGCGDKRFGRLLIVVFAFLAWLSDRGVK
jgi:hypothetical protein